MRWLIAKTYDRIMARQEAAVFGLWRDELLAGLEGTIVEIGAGTGRNLDHYGEGVSRLVLSEPTPIMREKLSRAVEVSRFVTRAEVLDAAAGDLPLGDGEADAVVSTLVLCSVDDPAGALAEARRVLRPGGRLVFFEHVASENPRRRRWQERLDPIWHFLEGTCHLNRETGPAIEAAGFTLEQCERVEVDGQPGPFAEVIRGTAVA